MLAVEHQCPSHLDFLMHICENIMNGRWSCIFFFQVVLFKWKELIMKCRWQSLDWELDTVNSSSTSTDCKFPTQANVHAALVLKPPTTSCNPAPPSMTWDARHGPVRWMPKGSFGDRLRHCGRLQTSPYSPDWKSSMAGNTEEEEMLVFFFSSWQAATYGSYWAFCPETMNFLIEHFNYSQKSTLCKYKIV